MFAVAVRSVAFSPATFRRNLDAYDTNVHCIPAALTGLSACLFTLFPINPADPRGSVQVSRGRATATRRR